MLNQTNHFLYLGIPLGAKLCLGNWRLGAALVPELGLSARYDYTHDYEGSSIDDESESGKISRAWDTVRRFNLGSRVTFGYAIPIGEFFVVPNVQWSTHLLDDVISQGDLVSRFSNLMLVVGVERGFGGS